MALQNTDLFVVDRGGTNYKMAADQVTAKTGANGASTLPSGTTAERPGAPVPGQTRWNTEFGYLEVYTNAVTQWNQLDYVPVPATLPADLTISTNTTLTQGTYYVNDLTINAGVTVTSTTQALVFICTGNVVIRGTIDLNYSGPAGGGYFESAASPASNQRDIGVPGLGIGGGGYNLDTNPYTPSVSIVGSAGGSGTVQVNVGASATPNPGGPGGGGIAIRSYGTITTFAGSLLTANGRNSFRNSQSATSGPGWLLTGSGGGSGGTIILHADKQITHNGAISVTGGAGSNAYSDLSPGTSTWNGGGGGGGGVVLIQSTFGYTGSGTTTLTGGAAGASVGTISTGGIIAGGGGGSNGGTGGGALVFTGPGGTLPYNIEPLTGGDGVLLTAGSPF